MCVYVGCAKKLGREEKESFGKMETEFTATADFSMRPPITEICGRGLTRGEGLRFWRREGGASCQELARIWEEESYFSPFDRVLMIILINKASIVRLFLETIRICVKLGYDLTS